MLVVRHTHLDLLSHNVCLMIRYTGHINVELRKIEQVPPPSNFATRLPYLVEFAPRNALAATSRNIRGRIFQAFVSGPKADTRPSRGIHPMPRVARSRNRAKNGVGFT